MNKPVSFELAKLLKEKDYRVQTEHFYSKYGSIHNLKPSREYEHLHENSYQLEQYFDGIYDWNQFTEDVDLSMRSAYNETADSSNCLCSAPTIAEVVMWLYDTHNLWITVDPPNGKRKTTWNYFVWGDIKLHSASSQLMHENSGYLEPNKAYEAAIKYTLENIIK